MNYYNEYDHKAAAWLRELISAGLIPAGEVDTRSISEVSPDEIRHYTQCHFFAGIGGWPLALALAGWPASRPVWTGSCPCQPFSSAGQGKGAGDDRHLWPVFRGLIAKLHPQRVFGEQVAQAIGFNWLDGVSADLEADGYAVGAVVLGAHSVGAPHIRQRLYWVADSNGSLGNFGAEKQERSEAGGNADRRDSEGTCGLGNTISGGQCGRDERGLGEGRGEVGQPQDGASPANESGNGCEDALRLGYSASVGSCGGSENGAGIESEMPWEGLQGNHRRLGDATGGGCGERRNEAQQGSSGHAIGSSWSRFAIVPCRDGKARRFEPGSFPLADGIPGRVGLLRGYGNAIVPQTAAEFVMACDEILTANA